MEHASRGRRSGNKGVGARWRGRFRIFSARHRSRTKVSHAENSGMTMLFFFFGGCSGVGRVLTTGVVMRRRATTGVDGTRGVGFCFFLGGCSGVGGGFFHARQFQDQGHAARGSGMTRVFCSLWGGAVAVCFEGCCGSMCWPQERQPRMPPRSGRRGGSGFCLGDFFAVGLRCREHGLTTGVVRHAWPQDAASHACRRGSGSTRG